MPKVEHVFFDHKNPVHQSHLEKLQKDWSHDRARQNLTGLWSGNEEHRTTPLENFIAARIKDEKELIRKNIVSVDEFVDTRLVLQYLDGKPAGFVKYQQGDRPFINFMFVKPELRETVGYAKPIYDENGAFLSMKPPSQKREKPLLLAKRMFDFITQAEGAVPDSVPTSPQGERLIEKYLEKG